MIGIYWNARSKSIEILEKHGGASEEGEMSAGTQGEIRVGPSHQVCSNSSDTSCQIATLCSTAYLTRGLFFSISFFSPFFVSTQKTNYFINKISNLKKKFLKRNYFVLQLFNLSTWYEQYLSTSIINFIWWWLTLMFLNGWFNWKRLCWYLESLKILLILK